MLDEIHRQRRGRQHAGRRHGQFPAGARRNGRSAWSAPAAKADSWKRRWPASPQFTETQDDLKKRTLGAVAYPAFLAVVGTVMVIVLVVFFVPKFAELFARLRERSELPVAHRMAAGHQRLAAAMGHLCSARWRSRGWCGARWLDTRRAAGGATACGCACRWPGRSSWAWRSPASAACWARCSHNGVPILRSLQISRDATGNRVLAAAIGEATENISAGQPLAGPLAASGHFPPWSVEMIAVAEQANNLENVLLAVADRMERHTWRRLDLAVRLIEPIMLLILAGVILVLVIALLLPVLKMSTTV